MNIVEMLEGMEKQYVSLWCDAISIIIVKYGNDFFNFP